jgi:hypothetical protein
MLPYLPFAAFSLNQKNPGLEDNMELWNEYEGRTIDGLYPLTKLLEPEGRSAFFSTSNGSGAPTVIRLIESHFDDEEILARWKKVAALDHENLVRLKKFGQVELDGTSLVYAVMEPAEANLGEILRGRRLTVLETRQLASSMVGALEALHANGLVHEHVEPGNVLAVGEGIKLRSDCVREAPEGEEGIAAKRRDVRDLALVLLRALTQQRTLEAAARELPLAEPFDQIVKKGVSGEWGLREIGALVPPVPVASASAAAPASVPAPVSPPARVSPTHASTRTPLPSSPVSASASSSTASASTAAAGVPRMVRPGVGEGAAKPVVAGAERGGVAQAPRQPRERVGFDREEETGGLEVRRIVYGVGSILILLLLWFLVHSHSASKGAAQKNAESAPVAQGNNSVAKDAVATGTAAVTPAPGGTANAPASRDRPVEGDGHEQWRVIAYTYNHEAEAKAKAGEIAGKHPELRPEVFSPNGRAPYLVALGGTMSRKEAFAFAGKAKRAGLPRDLYAQNYRKRR